MECGNYYTEIPSVYFMQNKQFSNYRSCRKQYIKNIFTIFQTQRLDQFQNRELSVLQFQYMDIFQLVGDFLHLIAMISLLMKIMTNRNVLGLSYRTQQLYLAVYVTRYIGIIFGWTSLYLFVMKILFISLTSYTIYLMRFKKPHSLSYDKENDKFPHYYIYAAAAVLAIIIHRSMDPLGFLWSFSIWLQAGSILPQLSIISKIGEVQNITAHYIFFLGLYRTLYIFHWIYNWQHVVWTSFLAGILQTALYADFIYYFIKSDQSKRTIQFPM